MNINIKEDNLNILITGGAGFIGSCLIKKLLNYTNANIFNLDKISYTSDFSQIEESNRLENYNFIKTDLNNYEATKIAINKSNPDFIFHLAAESHVDRSIDNSRPFIQSNIIGTFNILEATKSYWMDLSNSKRKTFRFLHVSTDEVFGSLGREGSFSEKTAYDPRSPYSASKAASDHLSSAWFHTFRMPIIRTNCSNNFGPYQFHDKLIPLIIMKAMQNEQIPIYGDGSNIRDWLYVEDHVEALILSATKGKIGSNYCVGGNNEKSNLEIANSICEILDKKLPRKSSYKSLIQFVEDRPGHDKRYAINSDLIKKELNWYPKYEFNNALENTIDWYIKNTKWVEKVSKKNYKGERIGLKFFKNHKN